MSFFLKLDFLDLLLSAITPVAVIVIGFKLNSRLKSIDQAQWQSRKIIEKRIEIFDKIAPSLNLLYCYFLWIGRWKEISPAEAIETKRRLDETIHVYGDLVSPDFISLYEDFARKLFSHFSGAGMDARLRTRIVSVDGDRMKHAPFDWHESYDQLFDTNDVVSRSEIRSGYDDLMACLKASIAGD